MSRHTSAVFNHSCLKVPVNPVNKLPAPTYEQKYINQLQNQALKFNSDVNSDREDTKQEMKTKKSSRKETVKSLIDFYDSIPDYSDINHLSNQEFYRRIENLKAKQKSYYEYLDAEYNIENKVDNFVEDYKKQASGERSSSRKSDHSKSIVKSWENYNQRRETPETESVLSFGKETPVAPPSRRSVRIESPKSDIESKCSDRDLNSRNSNVPKRNVSSAGSKDSNKSVFSAVDNMWDDYEIKEYCDKSDDVLNSERNTALATRSLPGSPVKNKQTVGWKDCGITIPKPFKMTVRDEEDRIVNEIIAKNTKPNTEENPEMFRAHPVPIESKIPLFDKIMEEQEIRKSIKQHVCLLSVQYRRQIVKERSKENLRSQMKPFSFTKREEEIQALTRRFSKSSPQLCPQLYATLDEPELQIKPFRAKPVPKNLFSNYIYRKMHEDEFYRALKKKIRAEEMLKASSLPPSMAAREKTYKKPAICPRSMREYDVDRDDDSKKSTQRIPNYHSQHEQLELELEHLKNDFITTTPRPFKFETAKRHEKKRARSAKKCYRASEYENMDNKRAQSALELQSVNRSNLAAVLRIQSARLTDLSSMPTPRKRMEMDMCRKLEEQKLKEEARWREKVMRQKPIWQVLNFSHEEDLAMRLQMRRDEERLREEEHQHHMELMLGRVQQMPTLFERQSHIKTPKTKKEAMQAIYNEMNYSPQLNECEPNDWEKLEQAIYNNNKKIQTHSSDKSDDEEKDKCESVD